MYGKRERERWREGVLSLRRISHGHGSESWLASRCRRADVFLSALSFSIYGISRARMLTFVCTVFARIRRLRTSPQYLLVISHGGNDSLRNSPQKLRGKMPPKSRLPKTHISIWKNRSRRWSLELFVYVYVYIYIYIYIERER